MNAAAIATAIASADLSAGGGAAALSGNAFAQATASGELTATIILTAAAISAAIATGGLTAQINLSGEAFSEVLASGSLDIGNPIIADAHAIASALASLTGGVITVIMRARTARITQREGRAGNYQQSARATQHYSERAAANSAVRRMNTQTGSRRWH